MDVKTLGDQIRKVRMDRGLLQREVSEALGANEWTIHNWETNTHSPETRFYPAIMNWLGYCPIYEAESLGEKIRRHRIYRGLSAVKLARMIGIDPTTLLAWEVNKRNPHFQNRSRNKLNSISQLPHPMEDLNWLQPGTNN